MDALVPYDGETNTALFLKYAEGCGSVSDLFEKIKPISDDILKGNITEGLVKVMLDCKKFFRLKNVRYAEHNEEGIDVYAEDRLDNKTIPVQVKFRSSEMLSNDDLNSFAKKNWLAGHSHGYVIGNLRDVPSDWHNDKVSLFLKEDFDEINLKELVAFASKQITLTEASPLTPRGYQPEWLKQVEENCAMARGKMLAPPGFGKTLGMASYVRNLKKNRLGFVGAPFIRLINQNMMNMVDELTSHGYNVMPLVVNSGDPIKRQDTLTVSNSDERDGHNIVRPVGTKEEIVGFIKTAKRDKSKKSLYIIFGCYGSTDLIIEACKGTQLDYGLFDEAQNLVGHVTRQNPRYLHNRNIKFLRRCFVTATEKVYNGENDEICAMNNTKLFGQDLAKCSFKQAIEHGNIKDYRVVFPALGGKQMSKWWNLLKDNQFVCDGGGPVSMAQVALKVQIYMMFDQYPIVRMIGGFNRIDNAKNMSEFLKWEDAITRHFGFVVKATWVSSAESQSTNTKRIHEFANSTERYVLCAPPMLKEGVDVKGKDDEGRSIYPNSVVFCDNKRGEIGIVQLAGRGLRMGPDKNELCYIGLPIIYHPTKEQKEIYNEGFERAKDVIVSLGCNDERVAQELTTLSYGKKPSKKYKTATRIVELPEVLASSVSFKGFVKSMRLSLLNSVEKASYEEHVKECKKYQHGRAYNDTRKHPKFYSSIGIIQKNWPTKNLYSDVGWANIAHGNKASYTEHVEFIKTRGYKNAPEYNSDKTKGNYYYTSIRKIVKEWPRKNIYSEIGWFNVQETKASYTDHIKLGKSCKNWREYLALNKPSHYYSAGETIRRRWPRKNFPRDCGWKNNTAKKSYAEHVSLGKKFPSQSAYQRASKSPGFYSDGKIIAKVFGKNFYRDCGWATTTRASYDEHVEECKKYPIADKYNKAKKDKLFYSTTHQIRKCWPNKNLFKDAGWNKKTHKN